MVDEWPINPKHPDLSSHSLLSHLLTQAFIIKAKFSGFSKGLFELRSKSSSTSDLLTFFLLALLSTCRRLLFTFRNSADDGSMGGCGAG